ncbi:hypothetical protein ACLMAL_35960 (plasmid) [Nocardia sp. CWNU-33]|uniref:hypothetical protein n=1 Tax=Nocardia sp. CWNU-33 TaxID=3392117 RepID=UPI00398E736A
MSCTNRVSVPSTAAHLDPQMQLQAWDDSTAVTFDGELWAELTSGLIPTRAGSTWTCAGHPSGTWAHPHACGEHVQC